MKAKPAPQLTNTSERTDPVHCLAILGPTCAWKSETALLVAKACNAEIISCDSMQVYRGLDVGTAKPTRLDRNRVTHHLVDTLEMAEPFDLKRFLDATIAILDSLHQRRRNALLVGGTGLYARALVYGYALPPADKTLFARISEECRSHAGLERLIRELHDAGANTTPELRANPRRIARAVEILRLTGKPPPAADRRRNVPRAGFRQAVITPSMDTLRARVTARTEQMFQRNWIRETRELLNKGFAQTPTARQALGYRSIAAFLQGRGPDSKSELQRLVVSETIAYARRQCTWFRNQHPDAVVIRTESASATAASIFAKIRDVDPCILPTVY